MRCSREDWLAAAAACVPERTPEINVPAAWDPATGRKWWDLEDLVGKPDLCSQFG